MRDPRASFGDPRAEARSDPRADPRSGEYSIQHFCMILHGHKRERYSFTDCIQFIENHHR
jgi:hypothetical protein